MAAGIIAGITWALETVILGTALSMGPFTAGERAAALGPFAAAFLHDSFSAIFAFIYNGCRGNLPGVLKALKTRNGWFTALAAVIGGPVGMTGYILATANLGPSIGAVASAVYPAIGAVLAYIFLKEKMQWYRWVFLLLSLLGVYGVSYTPGLHAINFGLGFAGTLMCAFGWGIEAVIIAGCVRGTTITNETALLIRQTTSAIVHGTVILPLMKGREFTLSLFKGTGPLIPVIAAAAFSATVSYLFYYKAISQIGPSKAMALNITYSAWAVIFSVIFFHEKTLLSPVTILCTLCVLIFSVLAAADHKDLFTG